MSVYRDLGVSAVNPASQAGDELRKTLASLDRDTALRILRDLLAENGAGEAAPRDAGVNRNQERNWRSRSKPKPSGKRQARLGLGGAGGARTHDRRIMRSVTLCIVCASCTDDTGYRADGPHRAGAIWSAGPRTGPRPGSSWPLILILCVTSPGAPGGLRRRIGDLSVVRLRPGTRCGTSTSRLRGLSGVL
jgi:hypothetical protein